MATSGCNDCNAQSVKYPCGCGETDPCKPEEVCGCPNGTTASSCVIVDVELPEIGGEVGADLSDTLIRISKHIGVLLTETGVTDLTDIYMRLITLENNFTQLDTDVTALTTTVEGNTSSILNLTTSIQNHEVRIALLEAAVIEAGNHTSAQSVGRGTRLLIDESTATPKIRSIKAGNGVNVTVANGDTVVVSASKVSDTGHTMVSNSGTGVPLVSDPDTAAPRVATITGISPVAVAPTIGGGVGISLDTQGIVSGGFGIETQGSEVSIDMPDLFTKFRVKTPLEMSLEPDNSFLLRWEGETLKMDDVVREVRRRDRALMNIGSIFFDINDTAFDRSTPVNLPYLNSEPTTSGVTGISGDIVACKVHKTYSSDHGNIFEVRFRNPIKNPGWQTIVNTEASNQHAVTGITELRNMLHLGTYLKFPSYQLHATDAHIAYFWLAETQSVTQYISVDVTTRLVVEGTN